MAPRIFGIVLILVIAGCSSFGPQTTSAPRALDPLHDDIGNVLIAFDLPRGIGAVPDASTLTLAVPGAKPIRATLTEADIDDVAGNLPPPANGRAYYLLQLSATDRAVVRAVQAAARSANVSPASIAFAIVPKLCVSADADTKPVTISVLLALPGGARLAPLIDHQPLAALAGAGLPTCA
jgi:hypothetical protein